MLLLDADTLIQAKNTYYAFDFAPGFWDWLDRGHAAGLLASVEAVGQELKRGHDELADWASARPSFFVQPGTAVPGSIAQLAAWVHVQAQYTAAARQEFLAGAGDLFLIAQAHGGSHTVVTSEQSRPESKKRVMIPGACQAVGVPCVDLFGALRATGGLKLVLSPAP